MKRKMSSKQNRDYEAASPDVWEPYDGDEDELFNNYEARGMYVNDFHDEERQQFQRQIMGACSGNSNGDYDDEEDNAHEGDGLMDTPLIASNQGKTFFIIQLCIIIKAVTQTQKRKNNNLVYLSIKSKLCLLISIYRKIQYYL